MTTGGATIVRMRRNAPTAAVRTQIETAINHSIESRLASKALPAGSTLTPAQDPQAFQQRRVSDFHGLR